MSRLATPSRRSISLLLAVPFIAAACGSATGETSTASPTEAAALPTSAAVARETTASAADTWRDIELTDVATGETFTLASLEGEVVAIEPMAIWCTSCKQQANNVKRAHAALTAAGVRYVSLGVEPNETPDALAKYAARGGYDWTFAQSPIEMSRALNDIFGAQILAVPSTPLIVLDETGEIVLIEYGLHAPEALTSAIDEVTA